ncbi:hypothetical protein BJY52DRAFT_236816 [Lactarius psammicola]|nr:hypothetical protein BJY52DRAFT_236816 [Lactarius psammicola]
MTRERRLMFVFRFFRLTVVARTSHHVGFRCIRISSFCLLPYAQKPFPSYFLLRFRMFSFMARFRSYTIFLFSPARMCTFICPSVFCFSFSHGVCSITVTARNPSLLLSHPSRRESPVWTRNFHVTYAFFPSDCFLFHVMYVFRLFFPMCKCDFSCTLGLALGLAAFYTPAFLLRLSVLMHSLFFFCNGALFDHSHTHTFRVSNSAEPVRLFVCEPFRCICICICLCGFSSSLMERSFVHAHPFFFILFIYFGHTDFCTCVLN